MKQSKSQSANCVNASRARLALWCPG